MARWLWLFMILTVTLELLEIITLAYKQADEWEVIRPLLANQLSFSFITIQMIIGALYETQAARQALLDDPDRAAESLIQAQQLLADVETEIRRVIYDLHPPVLDAMGLVVALKRFAGTFAAAFGIDCQVQVIGRPRRLSKETEVAIYRIIQAALHNVASHAQAHRVQVGFEFGADSLRVTIEDDGLGFDPEAVFHAPGEHLGLIGMRERARMAGGHLRLETAPGRGVRVHLWLPTRKDASNG